MCLGRAGKQNGYYTWPRYGFNGPLPGAVRRILPPGLDHAQCVLDLVESVPGRCWWRRHGTTLEVVFDLAERSRSWQSFARYVREKAFGQMAFFSSR